MCMARLISAVALLLLVQTAAASGQTLDRIRETGTFTIGFREDAPPFSFAADDGAPRGYSIALCRRIAAETQTELGLPELEIAFVPVDTDDRFDAIVADRIDLLCGATTATLARRELVSFSLPTFITGVSALLRADASRFLRRVLSGEQPTLPPRYLVHEAFRDRTMGARAGTTAETWLRTGIEDLATSGEMVSVASHEDGLRQVQQRELDAYFADRAILKGLVAASDAPDDFLVADRLFTYEPYALALSHGDEAFRLHVDRTLSRLYRSGEIRGIYTEYFGPLTEIARTLFAINSLPE